MSSTGSARRERSPRSWRYGRPRSETRSRATHGPRASLGTARCTSATSSSAWAFELGLLEADLRERLSERLGDRAPTQLRFAPGPLPEPTAPDPGDAERRAPNVTDQHVQAGEEVAAAIADENLRKLVAKAAAASLAKPPDDRSV